MVSTVSTRVVFALVVPLSSRMTTLFDFTLMPPAMMVTGTWEGEFVISASNLWSVVIQLAS